jgi:hypothetical protein
MRSCLEVKPLQAWYYCISPNFRTLVILLKVDPTSSDEPKTIYKGFYEIENTPSSHIKYSVRWTLSLVAWFNLSTTFNNKADYLIHTI